MQTITVYKAADGRRFDTEKEAQAHEDLLSDIARAEEPLGTRPSDSSFSNGGGYIEHTPAAILTATERADALVKKSLGERYSVRDSVVGRILSDGDSPLYDLWCRLACIDAQDREWGQRYYAANPTEGKQVPWRAE